MTEKTLTTENIRPALDALRGELAPWPVVAKKQDRLNTAQLNAANSGITSSLVAQIIANTAAIRALESAITGTGLRALVVASLPAVGTTGILYIVPVTTYDPDTDADVVNYSNEYIWIPVEAGTESEGHYEQVGQTGIVINNGQLTITVNGTSVGTFTANQSGDTTAAITVPTNADYVDRTTNQTIAGTKTFSSTINGTAAKAIADEDGTSIKTGYVNVAGNQTVSGQKTWSGNQFFTSPMYPKNTSYEIGNTPASNVAIPIYFTDKNNVYTGYVRSVVLATGRTQSELYARNKFTNGALSPTGTDVSSTLQVEVQSDGTKSLYFDGSIRNNVLPYATNTYSLGSSSYQWSSVYAQTYYYNGTAWGLDKANVWTGSNRFRNFGVQSANTIDITQSTYANSQNCGGVGFSDAVNRFWGDIELNIKTDATSEMVFNLSNWKADGTQGVTDLRFRYDKALTTVDFFGADRVVNLGTSTNQWKSVYAQSYYYNGTAWGLDKANVWTNTQTYSAYNYGQMIWLKNTGLDLSVNGNTGLTDTYQQMIHWVDKNNAVYSSIQSWTASSENTLVLRSKYRTNANTVHDLSVRFTSTATNKVVYPETNADTELGTSTNKWKTLNGVNPGALGMPINANSASFNIDTTNWTTDGSIIIYTPLLDGWLYINARNDDTNGDSFIIFDDGVSGFGTSVFGNKGLPNNGIGLLCLMMPVNKNNGVNIRIKSPGIISARLYPCNGNV